MLKLSVLGALAVLMTVAVARPQTGALWSPSISTTSLGDGQTAGSVVASSTGQFVAPPKFQRGFRPVRRQGRRIGDDDGNVLSNRLPTLTTTTTPAPPTGEKKLVTLRPIGNNIQEILYNNGYRETPGEYEPDINNIDDYDNLDGLAPEDVWLLDEDLLVIKGGALTEGILDTTPIDDYEAPYREPKFPPPGFRPDSILPPGSSGRYGTAGTFFTDGRGNIRKHQRQPEAFIPEFGYNPYGVQARTGRLSAGSVGSGAPALGFGRAVLPPAGFKFPSTQTIRSRPEAPTPATQPEIPRHTHEQVTYVKKNAGRFPASTTGSRFQQPAVVGPPASFISSFDSLPHSFSSNNQYPAAATVAPASTVYKNNGNYMTYTNHDGGFSFSYKTTADGQSPSLSSL